MEETLSLQGMEEIDLLNSVESISFKNPYRIINLEVYSLKRQRKIRKNYF